MNISLKFYKLPFLILIIFSYLSCDVDEDQNIPLPALSTITEIASNNSDLSNLVAALSAADGDLLSVLNGGNYTLLAPNNWAFENFLSKLGKL